MLSSQITLLLLSEYIQHEKIEQQPFIKILFTQFTA